MLPASLRSFLYRWTVIILTEVMNKYHTFRLFILIEVLKQDRTEVYKKFFADIDNNATVAMLVRRRSAIETSLINHCRKFNLRYDETQIRELFTQHNQGKLVDVKFFELFEYIILTDDITHRHTLDLLFESNDLTQERYNFLVGNNDFHADYLAFLREPIHALPSS